MSDGLSEIALDESSPRPWYFDGWDIFSAGTTGGVNNDGHRLVLPASHLDQTWHESQRMNRADLKLIVEAVNSYDALRTERDKLVEALDDLLAWGPTRSRHANYQRAIVRARAALVEVGRA